MNSQVTILCPVDFSDASRGALRHAKVITEHFGARLIVLAVEDPLLIEAVDLGTGVVWNPDDTRQELERFVTSIVGGSMRQGTSLEYAIAVGKPAKQILHLAQEQTCDLIVMSTHGLTGMRKRFFGSTTERVLRETRVPVLATPPADEGPRSTDDIRSKIGRVLVPVDLSSASVHQLRIAWGISEALGVPLVATYVVEPVRSPLASKLHLPSIDLERKTRAEDALGELLTGVPQQLHHEALVAYGDPAEEVAKIARDRHAGLIVIGLHGSPLLGPHMGSVTYRVLSLTSALVLALPPQPEDKTAASPNEARSFVHK